MQQGVITEALDRDRLRYLIHVPFKGPKFHGQARLPPFLSGEFKVLWIDVRREELALYESHVPIAI
jgi:hypothetical protein